MVTPCQPRETKHLALPYYLHSPKMRVLSACVRMPCLPVSLVFNFRMSSPHRHIPLINTLIFFSWFFFFLKSQRQPSDILTESDKCYSVTIETQSAASWREVLPLRMCHQCWLEPHVNSHIQPKRVSGNFSCFQPSPAFRPPKNDSDLWTTPPLHIPAILCPTTGCVTNN